MQGIIITGSEMLPFLKPGKQTVVLLLSCRAAVKNVSIHQLQDQLMKYLAT